MHLSGDSILVEPARFWRPDCFIPSKQPPQTDISELILHIFCYTIYCYRWWSGVLVSTLASINEVNLRWARLLLRWMTVSGFNSRRWTLISVRNQPATQGQLV